MTRTFIKNPEDAYPNMGLMRWEIINALILKNGFTSYLEVGVQTGQCFEKIKCVKKVGVDPDRRSKATIHQTSDLFFSLNTEKYDLVFIDGLHESQQAERDYLNAMKVLNPEGIIVAHDLNPTSEKMQRVPRETSIWCGNAWAAFVKLRTKLTGWEFATVDTDFGTGLIYRDPLVRKGLHAPVINWENFTANRKKWLNLISVHEFNSTFLNAK